MQNQKKAYFYGTLAVLFWSTVASAFKISLRHINILPLLFYASISSTTVLFLILLSLKKLSLLKTLPKKACLHSALLGLINPCLYYLVLFKAYSMLPAQEALVLNFTWPIMLVLLSIPLLGQRINLKSILAILISFSGVLIISTRGNIFALRLTNPAGVFLALASSVIWAFFWIYNVKDKTDETVKLFLNFAFGSAFLFLLMLLSPKPFSANIKGLLGAIYIGLFEMGITFLCWLKALKLSRTTAHIANLIYLVPFLSIIVIHLVVGEKIFLSTPIGLLAIIAGIILQKITKPKI